MYAPHEPTIDSHRSSRWVPTSANDHCIRQITSPMTVCFLPLFMFSSLVMDTGNTYLVLRACVQNKAYGAGSVPCLPTDSAFELDLGNRHSARAIDAVPAQRHHTWPSLKPPARCDQ